MSRLISETEAPRLVSVCAWRSPGVTGPNISHTICPPHKAKQLQRVVELNTVRLCQKCGGIIGSSGEVTHFISADELEGKNVVRMVCVACAKEDGKE